MDCEQGDIDTGILLKELLEISNRSATSRFSKKPFYNSNTAQLESNDGEGTSDEAQLFLEGTPEDSALNQYWYSKSSMKVLCEAIAEALTTYGKQKVAFLSTPSLYFAMPIDIRHKCCLFEFDTIWAKDKGFQKYDFNKPLDVKEAIRGTFDMVVIDPPFITHDCWEKYKETVSLLLTDKDGLVMATTVTENEKLMNTLFGAEPNVFRPDIPNLVYRYKLYTNFDSKVLSGETL